MIHAGAGMLRLERTRLQIPLPPQGSSVGSASSCAVTLEGPHVPGGWTGPRLPTGLCCLSAPPPPAPGDARGLRAGHLTLAGNCGLGSGAAELPCPPPSGLGALPSFHSLC